MKHTVTCTNRIPQPIGIKCVLFKEPTNAFDNEAIAVSVSGIPIGYVSAVYKTRKPNTVSCGRIYDLFDSSIPGTFITPYTIEIDFS
jgi:hypothetical protein